MRDGSAVGSKEARPQPVGGDASPTGSGEAAHEARADIYRELLDKIEQGFCILEMIEDGDGRPLDYRFLEVNPTFERHTGLVDAVGRTARELVPDLEDHWVEIYGRVARTGEPLRFEQGSVAMGRLFSVDAVRVGGPGSRMVGLIFNDITEHRRTVEALRASEEALATQLAEIQSIYDTAPVGLTVIDTDLRFVRINERLAAMNGLPAAAHRGRLVREVLPDVADQAEALLRRVIETGEPVLNIEITGETPAEPGAKRIWNESLWPVRDGSGKVIGIGVVTEEITDKRAAERALADSEARFRATAEAVPGLVFESTSDGCNRFVNRGFCEFSGREPEGLLDRLWMDLVHPEDLERVAPAWEDAAKTGRTFEAEYRFRRHDGAWRWHLVRSVPQRDPHGGIVGWIGTATDIEEMVRAREALAVDKAALERRVEAVVAERNRMWQLSPDLFGVLGPDGTIHSVNPSWTRVLGHAEAAFASRRADAFIHPDDLERTSRVRERLARGELVLDHENRWRHVDGTWRWLAWAAMREGERVYCVARDVTEQKAAAERLRATELELFQVQKMETVGQLTGGVAHDFNNLLAAVLSNLELARKQVGDDPRLARLIDGAIQGTTRGTTLTRRLLAFARRQELHSRSVDVAALIRGMDDLLLRTLGPGIRIQADLADGLPQVEVDPNQLELAILNLAVNARDAMVEGGVLSLSAHVDDAPEESSLSPGSYVRLVVRDSGTGMDEVTLARAAEPFFTTKGLGKGTGLGLSMVQGLAAQSGGAIRLASRTGEGTTVTLWLPRASEAGAAPDPVETPSTAPTPTDRPALTILVVDDDSLVAMSTSLMLEDMGHRVLDATSGTVALERLAGDPTIDLVITDHGMPGMTGVELAERIAERHPDLPVILATGYGELPGGRATTLPRLDKPYGQASLQAAVEAAIAACAARARPAQREG